MRGTFVQEDRPLAERVPQGSRCACHPAVEAGRVCVRCGLFMCPSCERRVRPEGTPMCPACFDLRSALVAPPSPPGGAALQTAGLILAILSLFPFLPAMVLVPISLAVNVVGLFAARSSASRAARWRPALGLFLTALAAGLSGLLFWSLRS